MADMAGKKKMKALVVNAANSPFDLIDIPRKSPGKGEVLVKIKASGLNPLDLKIQSGVAGHANVTFPAILGIDLAGVVEEVGEGVTHLKVGDEIYGMAGGVGNLQGSLAEYVAVDADFLAVKSKKSSMREAAAIPLIFITAWEGLVDRAGVKAGKTVLVHGGAGGVGHMAVQLAKAHGAQVFATGKISHKDTIESFGATFIDYEKTPVEEYVRQYTAGEGFDIVYDTLGGETLDTSFQAVKTYTGHVVSCLGWGTHKLAPLSFKGATYSGVFTLLPILSGKHRSHHGDILQSASALVDEGKLRVLLDKKEFRLADADKAYDLFRQRKHSGKVVIEI